MGGLNTLANIYEKLMLIQNELKCPKDQFNSFGKYHYRSTESILEAVKPLLKKNGLSLFVSDSIELIGERYYIKATCKLINTEDGETIEASAMARESLDKKGMDSSQVSGATSSYARKYALNGLFLIDDTKDFDSAEVSKQTSKSSSSTNTGSLTEKQIKRLYAVASKGGFNAEQVKLSVIKDYKKEHVKDLSKKEYDELVSRLEKASLKGDVVE